MKNMPFKEKSIKRVKKINKKSKEKYTETDKQSAKTTLLNSLIKKKQISDKIFFFLKEGGR